MLLNDKVQFSIMYDATIAKNTTVAIVTRDHQRMDVNNFLLRLRCLILVRKAVVLLLS